jgi:hypothetical protein
VSIPRIRHDIPGRLRVWVPGTDQPETLLRELGACPGVTSTQWTYRTRSVLVLYDRTTATRERLLSMLGHSTDAGLQTVSPRVPSTSPGRLAVAVQQSANELDSSLLRATGGVLDLRFTVPLLLLGWAFLEVVRGSLVRSRAVPRLQPV